MRPEELRRLSQTRIKEASVLLDHEYYEGAVYLAGYAVELALKEIITKTHEWDTFGREASRDFLTHKLEDLLRLSGIQRRFRSDSANVRAWSKLKSWGPDNRYGVNLPHTHEQAQHFLDNVIFVVEAIWKLG
jgi:HEPN domain-containing protein